MSGKHATVERASSAGGGQGWGGIGSRLASHLGKLGIHCPADLLLHLPLRYEDETRLTPIARVRPGLPVQVEAEVVDCEVVQRPRRQLVARLSDASGTLVARWLNFYPSLQKQLVPGTRLRLYGEVRGGFFGDEMVHPRVHVTSADEPLPEALTPVYPTTAGLAQSALRKLIGRELDRPRDDAYERHALKQEAWIR